MPPHSPFSNRFLAARHGHSYWSIDGIWQPDVTPKSKTLRNLDTEGSQGRQGTLWAVPRSSWRPATSGRLHLCRSFVKGPVAWLIRWSCAHFLSHKKMQKRKWFATRSSDRDHVSKFSEKNINFWGPNTRLHWKRRFDSWSCGGFVGLGIGEKNAKSRTSLVAMLVTEGPDSKPSERPQVP